MRNDFEISRCPRWQAVRRRRERVRPGSRNDALGRLRCRRARLGTSDAESSCSHSDTADGRLHHVGRLGVSCVILSGTGARRFIRASASSAVTAPKWSSACSEMRRWRSSRHAAQMGLDAVVLCSSTSLPAACRCLAIAVCTSCRSSGCGHRTERSYCSSPSRQTLVIESCQSAPARSGCVGAPSRGVPAPRAVLLQ
jgi:hypothetical protein